MKIFNRFHYLLKKIEKHDVMFDVFRGIAITLTNNEKKIYI